MVLQVFLFVCMSTKYSLVVHHTSIGASKTLSSRNVKLTALLIANIGAR